jgi:hypothetical protein
LCFRQRPFGLLTRRGLGGQRGFSALQAAAGGCRLSGNATVRRQFVTLVPSQNRHRDIAILDETAAMQSAVKPVAHAARLVCPVGVGPVTRGFTEEAQRLSHLRFGFIALTRVT